MTFVRSIGRWTMTALVINCTIGSGIFGVPSELTRLLGRASPIAMVLAGLAVFTIMMCFAEVGSQFSEPGGCYLYARTAFGRLAGIQVGWFWWLSCIGGGAANATLFVLYLSGFYPAAGRGVSRIAIITALVALPTVVNYIGVRQGARLNTFFTVAKLAPLVLLIVLGVARFSHSAELIPAAEITGPGLKSWLTALLLLVFSYGGFEDTVIPSGEVKEPRRTIPFGMIAGLLVCMAVYTLLQFVTVATIGNAATDQPLARSASVLLGSAGGLIITVAVLLSTYGWISGAILNAPRLPCAFALNNDAPQVFARLHPRYKTPALAIVLYASLMWVLAVTGTFMWALAVTAGSQLIFDGAVCAALIRLRRTQPDVSALRIPLGRTFALVGIVICIAVLTRLDFREVLLMFLTALIALANWIWVRHRGPLQAAPEVTSATAPR